MRRTEYFNRARSCLKTNQTGLRATDKPKGGSTVRINNIVVTESDYARLRFLIDSARRLHQFDAERLDELENELNRARVVKSGKVSADVVTMNSRVRMKDLNSGCELTYQIVFPQNADTSKNRISVLAPIGTALLGYRAGTTIEWRVPSGMRRLRILDVEYQPEAVRMAA